MWRALVRWLVEIVMEQQPQQQCRWPFKALTRQASPSPFMQFRGFHGRFGGIVLTVYVENDALCMTNKSCGSKKTPINLAFLLRWIFAVVHGWNRSATKTELLSCHDCWEAIFWKFGKKASLSMVWTSSHRDPMVLRCLWVDPHWCGRAGRQQFWLGRTARCGRSKVSRGCNQWLVDHHWPISIGLLINY